MANHKRVIGLTPAEWTELYVAKGITAKALAARFETTPEIIKRHLQEAGLQIRGRGGRNEAHAFLHRHEDLIRRMLDAGKRCPAIAAKIGCCTSAVHFKAAKMGYILPRGNPANLRFTRNQGSITKGIETRRAKGYFSDPRKNSNWRGGVSPQAAYGFGFTRELKAQIRKRDNQRCRICGTTKNRARNGGLLDVHHRDRNKLNNDPSNLITLCRSCHTSIDQRKATL